jgi:hypothetical protein
VDASDALAQEQVISEANILFSSAQLSGNSFQVVRLRAAQSLQQSNSRICVH